MSALPALPSRSIENTSYDQFVSILPVYAGNCIATVYTYFLALAGKQVPGLYWPLISKQLGFQLPGAALDARLRRQIWQRRRFTTSKAPWSAPTSFIPWASTPGTNPACCRG